MKYFVSDQHWDAEGYWEQLRSLQGRMSKSAFRFWTSHSLHDWYIRDISIHNLRLVRRRLDPTAAEVSVLAPNASIYTLRYTGVVRISLEFDGRTKTLVGEDGITRFWEKDYLGLDQWGYDELTLHDDTYLSHEVEFSSGAKLLLHFRGIEVRRATPKKSANSRER